MRSEGSPLDLNNLPAEDNNNNNYFKDGKQTPQDCSSTSVYRKKKSSTSRRDEKDAAGKVYQCRFCSVKFCKSQALGGHMNRHRQERETETLNKARHLVLSTDLGYISSGQPVEGDATMPFRSSIYPTRTFSTGATQLFPPPLQHRLHPQPYMYTTPSRVVPHSAEQLVNDHYFVPGLPGRHVLSGYTNSAMKDASDHNTQEVQIVMGEELVMMMLETCHCKILRRKGWNGAGDRQGQDCKILYLSLINQFQDDD